MKIEKTKRELGMPYAEEAAALLGVKSSLVEVSIGPSSIEVTMRDAVDTSWHDIPVGKVAAVTTWAESVLAERK